MNWHSVDTRQLCKTYGTGERSGLADYRCTILRQKHGENVLTTPCSQPYWQYVKQSLLSILSVNALLVFLFPFILFCMGRLYWAWALLAMVFSICSILLRAFLAYRADRSLKRFDALSVPTAEVVRGGVTQRIDASELVPGDLIILHVGDRISADARLLECNNLRCDESVLTGRSLPALKRADVLLDEKTPMPDRINMVHMGCDVVSGSGRAVVTATGMKTELGKLIVSMHGQRKSDTQKHSSFDRLGLVMTGVALFVTIAALTYSLLASTPFGDLFETLATLVCSLTLIPLTAAEAAVVRMGERRLAIRHAVIKRTGMLETLGQVSVICTEKDGVLTQNNLTVDTLWAYGVMTQFCARLTDNALALLKLCALCSNAVITFEDGEERHLGSPAEIAVLDAAMRNGMKPDELSEEYPRIAEIPYTSERRRMTAIHMIEGVPVVIVKGGFDILLPMCTEGIVDAQDAHDKLCERELRVIAIAYKQLDELPDTLIPEELECDLTLAGLIGLSDPLRTDAARAVSACETSEVRLILMTEDNINTACATARSLGILSDEHQAISGETLALFTDSEIAAVAESLVVYARISEQDKARVIRAWRAKGHTVLAVGSGMRDLPALKAADVGCCMRECAGEGMKSACDVLITNDRFSTVLEAIRESRLIKENLWQAARYLLCSCFASLFASAAALGLGITSLIRLPQVLLVNLFVSLWFAIALGTEPSGQDRRRIESEQGLTAFAYLLAALKGLLCALFVVGAYFVGAKLFITDLMEPSHAVGCSMAFIMLLLSQCALAASCRSRTQSAVTLGLFSSPFYNLALVVTILLWAGCSLLTGTDRYVMFSQISIVHHAAAVMISIVFSLFLALCRLPAIIRAVMLDRFG